MKTWFALYFVLFFLIGGGARGLYFRKRYRVNPMTILRQWTVYAAWFRLMAFAALMVVAEMAAYVLWNHDAVFVRMPQPYLGGALMLLGIATMGLGQHHMGMAWRVGLPNDKTALKTKGVYCFSRNPIYVGLVVTMLGAVLSMPTLLAVVGFVLMLVALHFVVRHEERYLQQQHGDDFLAYKKRVARWISFR